MEIDKILINQGKILSFNQSHKTIQNLKEVEFRIFSQFEDDGIIQYLVNKIKPEEYFVEFGVENYLESNTRFLLQNNNWRGLVLDGNEININSIKSHYFFWKHDLAAIKAFITAENINQILREYLPVKDVGLLHIDVDGNDYWIWKAIECITPAIVIIEYNSVFGSERAITVPYFPDFVRTKHHYSNLYAGCSLLSLCDLADMKGYFFVGSNSAGNNAYFVKKELIGDLRPLPVKSGYVESKFRESRDKNGTLTFLRSSERLSLIKGMKVYNTRTDQIEFL